MNVYHFTIAWRNLVQGGRRVRLLGIALAAVAGLLILLLSLSNGIHQNLIRAATTIASGHVNVAGFYKTSPNAIGAPVVNNRDEIKAVIKDASPHIVSIIDRHRGWAKMVTEEGSIWAGLYGINVDNEAGLLEQMKSIPSDSSAEKGLLGLRSPNTIALFQSQAERLKVGPGDKVTLRTETMRGMAIPWTSPL